MSYKLFTFCLLFSTVSLYPENSSVVVESFEPESLIEQKDSLCEDTLPEGAIGISDSFIIAAASGDIDALSRSMSDDKKSVNYAEPVLGLTSLLVAVAASNEPMVKFLLAQPEIDINLGMKDGLTPLHCAVLQNDVTMLKLLLASSKLDLTVVESNGLTAESMARTSNYTECLRLLEEYKTR